MIRLFGLEARRMLVALLISIVGAETALPQAPTPDATAAQAASSVSAAELEALLADLKAGKERLTPMLETIDVALAEAWLAASPLDSLALRAADPALSEDEKTLWQTALEHEQAGAERVRGPLDRAQLVLTAQDQLDDAVATVDEMLESLGAPRSVEDERTLSQIEDDLVLLNSRRTQVALDLDTRRQTVARLEEQSRTQAETLAQLMREQELTAAGAGAAGAGQASDSILAEASRAALEAEARRAEARIIAAELDAQTLPPRLERLRLLIRQQEAEDRWLAAQIRETEAALAERSTAELRSLTAEMQRLIEREPDVPALYAQELSVMRVQIDEIADAQSRVRELRLLHEEAVRTEQDLTQTLANLQERLEVGGLNETLGRLFLEEQRRLRSLGDFRFRLSAGEQALTQSRLRSISLREQLRASPAPAPFEEADLREESAENVIARLKYQLASMLVQSEEAVTDQLRRNEAQLRAVIVILDELERILRETLLWWPSHPPVSLDWAMRVPASILALFDTRSWQEIRSALVQVTVSSPASTLLTLLVVVVLFRAGRNAGRHLRALAEKTQHRFTDNIGLTFRAMGVSLLRVLPVPALLASTSYRLQQVPETGPGIEILAAMLFSAAIWWLAGHLTLIFISRNGVGTVHFGWNACVVRRLRRDLAWYLPIQFLLIITLALAFGHPSDLVFDVVGRAALVAAGLLTGVLAWRLLAPSPELAPSLSERKRRSIRLAAVVFAGVLVILALAGYLLTVSELLERTIDTAVVVGVVWLGYRLATRALILSETQLRIRRLREQRSKIAAAESNSPAGEHTPDIPEPHLSIEDINQQTRALVRVLAGGAVVLALFWVWAEILPALSWLDGVSLWSRTITVGGVEILSEISLQDVLLAVFLVGLFGMAARNLPGLVEIILARSTRMDGAARYTATTLLRYAILVVAVVSVFSLLGLRWSELQWLVAALTLGLGFGLQEVVANFVSGLIMLFERPVRVGDTITIGEFSGTVARIRTRATTIIDWDNREIVVPNKMFITERLINWTLSDTMTRIVIPVGVSYSADIDLVMQSLKEIADEHPLIMKEPPPSVLFLRLGDSTLNFELRAYVNQLRDRWETVSDLHRRIIAVFRQRGIEIAFPQMDLHIRSSSAALPEPMPAPLPPVGAATSELGGAVST